MLNEQPNKRPVSNSSGEEPKTGDTGERKPSESVDSTSEAPASPPAPAYSPPKVTPKDAGSASTPSWASLSNRRSEADTFSKPTAPAETPSFTAAKPSGDPEPSSYSSTGLSETSQTNVQEAVNGIGSTFPLAEPVAEKAPPDGLLDMVEGESIVQEVDSGDEGKFILTTRRLIYHGKSFENSLFSSAAIDDITSVELSRKPRDSRSAWWGVAGAIASVAVWQVTTNETVGAVAGAAVGAISALLLADFWFRPPGLVLRFSAAGGGVSGPVSGKRAHDAEKLAARLQQLRFSSGAVEGAKSEGPMRPPGGSPGLF